jgi:hypothetical protein
MRGALEIFPIPDTFFTIPNAAHCRMTRKQLRSALLQCPFMACGRLYELKGKHMGAGVYEVRAIKWESTDGR